MSTYKYEYGVKFELDFNNFIKQSSLLCVLLLFFLCFLLSSSFLFRCVPFLVSNTTSHVFVGVVVCAKIIPLIRTR